MTFLLIPILCNLFACQGVVEASTASLEYTSPQTEKIDSVQFEITRSFDCDVLVVGGGPAGIASAVSAARHGASTILCERGGYLGGAATNALVGPFMSSTSPDGEIMLIRGFFEELVDSLEANGAAIHPLKAEIGAFSGYREPGHHGVTTFDPEALKRTAERFCIDAGVRLLYHCLFVKSSVSKDRIDAAYFATKDGIWRVRAKVYIDCTGDADVAYSSGVPCVWGDGNGEVQASSLIFILSGVDWDKMDAHYRKTLLENDFEGRFYMREIRTAREAGEFPLWRAKIALYRRLDGTAIVNMGQTDDVDGCDPEQVTRAEITGREQAQYIIRFLRKYVDGCKDSYLVSTAENLGVRESRRIVGEYTVTTEDAINSVKYPDPVFCCSNSMDIHKRGYVEYVARNTQEPYFVPYRALLPKGIDNLICAGRCISAERPVLGAIRVMPPCFAMGQAAGTAAALCIEKHVGPKQLDAGLLIATLKNDAAYLP